MTNLFAANLLHIEPHRRTIVQPMALKVLDAALGVALIA